MPKFKIQIPLINPRPRNAETLNRPDTHIEVEVDYTKGGLNYFSGGTIRRGYYMTAKPVAVHDGSVSYMLFGTGQGVSVCLEETKRLNPKRLQVLADAILPKAIGIAACIEGNDKAEAVRIAREAAGLQAPVAPAAPVSEAPPQYVPVVAAEGR